MKQKYITVKDVDQCMIWIGSGDFFMGSPKGEEGRDNDERRHLVIIHQGFWLADTACTQALWQAVMNENPSHFRGAQRPMENVSWHEVLLFIKRLNVLVPGQNFRLPTDAEWEYACRAGTQTPFCFGEQITTEQVNYDGNYPYAGGKKGKYREETIDVKVLPCNSWGLYQMHGNVWEWCQDRIIRGGSWLNSAHCVQSAFRGQDVSGIASSTIGFRLAGD